MDFNSTYTSSLSAYPSGAAISISITPNGRSFDQSAPVPLVVMVSTIHLLFQIVPSPPVISLRVPQRLLLQRRSSKSALVLKAHFGLLSKPTSRSASFKADIPKRLH
ncbi:MAG: hypothetical protein ACLSCX_08215 [Oscillospiraceae bacterium]